jgi:hypothetical protein
MAVLVAGATSAPEGAPAGRPALHPSVEPALHGRDAASPRLDGEYGLYVGIDQDSLNVRWITASAGPAVARLTRDGEVLDSAVSPSGRGHIVSFDRPNGSAVTLEYGSATDSADLHRTLLVLDEPRADRDPRYPAPDSLFVLGDVHGEFDNMVGVLRNAGLVGPDLHWTGGHATLASVGDLVDRGNDATRVLWFLYRLEREASAAGGRVLVMLGNHEIMVMTNDLRYTRSKERLVAELDGLPYWQMIEPRRSLLGRWLASKPALARIGNVLLAHGGLSDAYADWSLRTFQDSLSRFLAGEVFRIWADSTYRPDRRRLKGLDSVAVIRRYDFFFGDSSVFWYRGYVDSDTLSAELAHVLGRRHSAVHVVGHTPLPTMRQSYGDSLVAVDLLEPATELLLMVRDDSRKADGGWRRYRIRAEGPPEPLEAAAGHAAAGDTAVDPQDAPAAAASGP